jgi:hypothetical protein
MHLVAPHRTLCRPSLPSIVLMIAGNAFLLVCMVGLGVAALGERVAVSSGDSPQQVVKAYLASKMPEYRYRICQWYAPEPLPAGDAVGGEDSADSGVAQRVKLVFYGPQGARQLDTVYVIRDGKVTRRLAPDHPDFVRNL